MYSLLLSLHSSIRYATLLSLIYVIVIAFVGWIGKKEFTFKEKTSTLVVTAIAYIQFVIGLMLYFMSPYVQSGFEDFGSTMKDADLRFWTVEHISMMIIAVALITLGKVFSNKATTDLTKYKRIAIYFTIGVAFMLMAIPWESF